ncbi:MAG: lysophospholipid acyltransferase family protein [Verrucomicrobiota bacterium]
MFGIANETLIQTLAPTLKPLWAQCLAGRENLPRNGPCIVIANHSSYLDFLILGSVFRVAFHQPLYFWANSKVMNHPVWKWVAKAAECIEVRSQGSAREQLKQSKNYLNRGRFLCIFPEGTRSRTGDLADFKLGYLKLAWKLNVPILPIVLHNAYEALPPQARFPRFRRIRLTIHPPISVSRDFGRSDLDRLNHQIRERIFLPQKN